MPAGPEIPEWADPRELDPAIRAALRGLDKRNAEKVAGHLVVAGTLVEEQPEEALVHARAARDRASRIAVVREAVGVAAYHAGDYAEAARELRAYRRMSGDEGYRAVLADCERALGRPEVALRLVREALADSPDADETTELQLVEAGARQDLGEVAAARVVLEDALGGRPTPETVDIEDDRVRRLASAYADLLAASGDEQAAERWAELVADAEDDVEFAETEIEEDESLDEAPLADAAGAPAPADAEPVGDDDVAEDALEEDEFGPVSQADIEAEVAELLGETDADEDDAHQDDAHQDDGPEH
ncbi:hypothetical protein [Blastococcus sp. SYSU D00820]